MKDTTDLIWAYLHDELSAENKLRFELSLKESSSLQQAVEAHRATHEQLQRALSQIDSDKTDIEELEDKLLSEWEEDHPEFQESRYALRNRIMRMGLPIAAAAAASLLLLALPGHDDPVHWQNSLYGAAPQTRGQSDAAAQYSIENLKSVEQKLQNAINVQLKGLDEHSRPWKLQIQLQELANGYLAIEVTGFPVDQPETVRIWSEMLNGLDRIDQSASGLALKIAADLAELEGL